MPSNNNIVLNLDEFNTLVDKLAAERRGVLRHWFEPRRITIDELRDASNLVMHEPRLLLAGPTNFEAATPLPLHRRQQCRRHCHQKKVWTECSEQ